MHVHFRIACERAINSNKCERILVARVVVYGTRQYPSNEGNETFDVPLHELWLSFSFARINRGKTRPNIYLVSEERAGKRVFYFISSLSSSFNTLRNIWATLKKCASQKINKTHHAFIRWWYITQFWGTHGSLKVEGTVGVNVAINLPDISFHSHSFIFIHFYGSPIRSIQGGGDFQNE